MALCKNSTGAGVIIMGCLSIMEMVYAVDWLLFQLIDIWLWGCVLGPASRHFINTGNIVI